MAEVSLIDRLRGRWQYPFEACGVILQDGSLVELRNIHPHPQEAFEFDPQEFAAYPEAIATWHTHPLTGGNLSAEDYLLFLQLPKLWHYIVGTHGDVRCYFVEQNRVILHDGPH